MFWTEWMAQPLGEEDEAVRNNQFIISNSAEIILFPKHQYEMSILVLRKQSD
jgi:hypothetical protein